MRGGRRSLSAPPRANANPFEGDRRMTLCPIAIAAGCRKCPVVAVCPLKSVIGDYRKEDADKPKAAPAPRKSSTSAK
jgi:hypothetical protein